jgi:hypothetical protein
MALCQLNQYSVSSLAEIRNFTHWGHVGDERFPTVSGEYKYLSEAEKKRSRDYKDFTYTINEIGCRGDLSLDKSIAFFGCSFTFGEGVAEEEIFPYLVSNNLNTPYINLGCIGYSIPQIAHLFHASLKVFDFDTVVITLPSAFRFHYVTRDEMYWPVFPNQDRDNIEHETIRKKVYPLLSEEYLLHQAKDYIIYMQTCADLYSKKIIWGTWDYNVQSLLNGIFGNCTKFEFDSDESKQLQGDFIARDNMHPGIIQHSKYSERIVKAIQATK